VEQRGFLGQAGKAAGFLDDAWVFVPITRCRVSFAPTLDRRSQLHPGVGVVR